MAYQLKVFGWSLFTLPAGIPNADLVGDSHANDPASTDYTPSATSWIGETFTFDGGAGTAILVNDDDGNFEDEYVETGGVQTLAQDVVINGTPYAAGATLENEFGLVDAAGNEVWVLRINGSNVGFVYPASSQPTAGDSFTAATGRDGNAADSGDGVTSTEAYATTDTRDGVVEGSDAGDTIDLSYTGDPDGDMIDDGAAGGPNGNGQPGLCRRRRRPGRCPGRQ